MVNMMSEPNSVPGLLESVLRSKELATCNNGQCFGFY